MNAAVREFPSLAQHFDVPSGYSAMFGWMCGYSADADFLDTALERFTRQTRAQRAWDGRAWLGLLLDPGNPEVSFVDAPGLVHCRIREGVRRPFNLLHAKVALLGFVHEADPDLWVVRLLVSTGNWTRQTVEESLDLAWRLDFASDSLESHALEDQRARADVAAAWQLIESLLPLFDARMLERGSGGRLGIAAQARATFEHWLAACASRKGDVRPRFFDNRSQSFLAQLPDQISTHAASVRRNYLAMGAGFYESSDVGGAFPRVPLAVRRTLQEKELLTKTPEVDLYVNPLNCQSIAAITPQQLEATSITIRPACAPAALFGANAIRSLHAKFLFGANYRDGQPLCRSGWIYLGSGNLTAQGFTLAAGPEAGNLEAGVVFAPPDLPWFAADAAKHKLPAIEQALPIGWDKAFESCDGLQSGDGFPDRPDAALACPVAWFQWKQGDGDGLLVIGGGVVLEDMHCQVLDLFGAPCPQRDAGHVWAGDRPRQVTLRWQAGDGNERQGHVPVVDEFGRVAGTPLPELSLEAARWQLAEFPAAPIDEDGPAPDPSEAPNGERPGAVPAGPGAKGGYPIRDMMGFVEALAERQVEVAAPDWPAWLARLEQTLLQAAKDPAVQAFVDLDLNPLEPLFAPPFRPDYADSADSAEGRDYEAMLRRVEHAWGVAGRNSIRSQQ